MRESRYGEEPLTQPPRRSRAKKALLDETGISPLEFDLIDDPVLNGDIPVFIMRKRLVLPCYRVGTSPFFLGYTIGKIAVETARRITRYFADGGKYSLLRFELLPQFRTTKLLTEVISTAQHALQGFCAVGLYSQHDCSAGIVPAVLPVILFIDGSHLMQKIPKGLVL